jgi:hypothetical protein
MRLIDLDEFNVSYTEPKDEGFEEGVMYVFEMLSKAPTVEAVPVVHGEWLDNGEKDVYGISKPFAISCSICGSSAGTSWMNFCPNCGSDMRKKVQE